MYTAAVEVIDRADIKRLAEMAAPVYDESLSDIPYLLRIVANGETPNPLEYTSEQILSAQHAVNRINISIADMSEIIDCEITNIERPSDDFLRTWCCLLVELDICNYDSDNVKYKKLEHYKNQISKLEKKQTTLNFSYSFSSENKRSYL